MTQDPDFQAIDHVLAGDRMAYAALVDRHSRYAVTVALKVLGNREDAEEAAQDAFVKAYKHLGNFNRQARFSTWLYRIVFNTAISYKRKRRFVREEMRKAEDVAAPETYPAEGSDRSVYLARAMDQLNEQDRVALTLYYLNEFSMEEIGEITGQQPNTLKVRIHRARQRLADALKTMLKEEAITL